MYGDRSPDFGLTPAALTGDVDVPGAVARRSLTLFTYMFLHADVDAHPRQHDLSLGVRRRCRGGAGPAALSGLLSAVRHCRRRSPSSLSDAHSQTPLIGASGAIAGVVIAYADAAALRQGHGAGVRPSRCASAPIGSSASSCSCSSSISPRRRRATSPIGAISAAWWRARSLFPLMRLPGVRAVRMHPRAEAAGG